MRKAIGWPPTTLHNTPTLPFFGPEADAGSDARRAPVHQVQALTLTSPSPDPISNPKSYLDLVHLEP